MTFLCTREPGELFLCGGNLPEAKPPVLPGPYVANVDPATGKQIWRTYVENANVTGNWIGVNNLNILANGTIVTAWSNQIALLDPDTGRILRTGTLPSGQAPPRGLALQAPHRGPGRHADLEEPDPAGGDHRPGHDGDGQGRPQGHENAAVGLRGGRWARRSRCSTRRQLPELAATPHGITMLDGRIAIYTCADQHAYRCFWDPDSKKLSLDESWVVPYLAEGQSTGDAPGIMGDWIMIQTNGIGGEGAVERRRDQPARLVAEDVGRAVRAAEEAADEPRTPEDLHRPRERHALLGRRRRRQGGGNPPGPGDGRDDDRVRRRGHDPHLPAADRAEGPSASWSSRT